jgi:SAM-dependent methyltransferase
MADSTENQLGRIARYDGWADGYDEYLTTPLYEKMPAHLARLVGRGRGLCVDLGCGTGVHLAVLGSLGWSVIGVDLSADRSFREDGGWLRRCCQDLFQLS